MAAGIALVASQGINSFSAASGTKRVPKPSDGLFDTEGFSVLAATCSKQESKLT